MRLDPNFILQEVGSDYLLVPVGEASARFHGVVRLNSTASFIAEHMRQDTDVEALVRALAEEYEGNEEDFRQSVRLTVDRLREANAILED